MKSTISSLESERLRYRPRLPSVLRDGPGAVVVRERRHRVPPEGAGDVRGHFPRTFGRPLLAFESGQGSGSTDPRTVGVVLSGGQAPGGHNVIAGLLDGLRAVHPDSRLVGFLGGPRGIMANRHVDLTLERVAPYRNTGGFDLIGSGRDKIETDEQFAACDGACAERGLDGLVIVGGDDSNTNAAMLAEYFSERDRDVAVVGAPKTIDGDLRSAHVELSFGFDTACRVYSELIGNICRDSASAGKYWHFIKLMGRSASHVTLECALQTHPNHVLIAEQVRRDGSTLNAIVEELADLVERRAASGKHYGVCLVPEGLIEFIPEMRALIDELNAALAGSSAERGDRDALLAGLTSHSRQVLASLPGRIRDQLLLDRDSHGNVQVSLIETETLIIEKVGQVLERRGRAARFVAQKHFFGYEGRCSAPSNFDADYTYTLGHVASLLVAHGRSGYMAAVGSLADPAESWRPGAVPLTSMMTIEERKGRPRPVIAKALVDLAGSAYRELDNGRETWATEDDYVFPGPIQYFGPPAVADPRPRTLLLERGEGR